MDKYVDVVVVGAGNGGLVAAATTARAGLKTLLIEKHNIPGGCATSFVRGRFEFEPSLHELCNVGDAENPGTIYKIFEGLGAKVDWRYDPACYRAVVRGKDGYDVKLPIGIEQFCDAMEKAVPGCRDSVHEMFVLKEKCDAATDYIYSKQGKPNPIVMLLKHADFMRCACHSVEDVENALGMPEKAKNIFNTYWGYLGVPTDELNCMHFINMIYSYVDKKPAMPAKRSHELSLSLCKQIYDAGGEIWYNSACEKMLYDDSGRCIGIVANGTNIYAKQVVSNAIPNAVINMSDPKKIPEHSVKLANARKFGISVATIYLGLDCSIEELGLKDYTTFIMKDPNPRKQWDTRNDMSLYIVNSLNLVVPDCTPEGTCSLFFTVPVQGSDLPKDMKPQDYKKYKNDLAKKFIEDYEQFSGLKIQEHIEEISVATPVTFARYLGTPDGTIYGYNLSGWDSILFRIQADAANKDNTIPGLQFCGGHGTHGDGYSSAYLSGSNTANKVIKLVKEGK